MEDGQHILKHREMFIDSVPLAVYRHHRVDGVLECKVADPKAPFVIRIPLDDLSDAHYVSSDAEGRTHEVAIEVKLSYWAGEPFELPRPLNCTAVPERIAYACPWNLLFTGQIDLYNDLPLPKMTEQAGSSNGG